MTTQNDSDLDGEIHSKFLLSAADFLNRTRLSSLRCHLNLHSASILNKNNYQLYTAGKKRTTVCQYCHTPWKCGDFTFQVRPKAKLGKKMRKILQKERNNQFLSSIQKKLAKMHHGNTVVLKCRTCEKQTRLKAFRKPQVPKAMEEPVENSFVIDNSPKMKKNRKKNKNKLCGLNPRVILKLHPLAERKESDVVDREQSTVSHNVSSSPNERENKNLLSDIFEGGMGKLIKHEQRESIRANPLPITPLGAKKAPAPNNKAMSDGFIPLSCGPSKKRTSLQVKAKTSVGESKKLLNPFSNEGQRQAKKTKSKKLNRWKKLMAAEEVTPIKSSSLQDFLSGIW